MPCLDSPPSNPDKSLPIAVLPKGNLDVSGIDSSGGNCPGAASCNISIGGSWLINNVGNFDAKGLNVNNNWDDNRNDNLGLASARQSSPHLEGPPSAGLLVSVPW